MEIRTTKPSNNKFYITKDNGGYSLCIKGYPTDKNANVLSNCVGYACGRFNEIIGDMKYPYLNCNAENFIERAKSFYNLEVVNYPTLGGIMVWQKGNTLNGNDGAGHVSIVERIDSDNQIYTSESGYGSSAFWNTLRNNNNGRWGMSNGYTFIGCIVNPAIGDIHYEQPNLKTLDEIAVDVINGKYGNYPERKELLEKDGYNYTEVQTKVNEMLSSTNDWIPKVGDKVYVQKTGKATSYGEYNTAKSNYEGIITMDLSGKNRAYPYLVSVNKVCIGWYKKDALKKI